MLQFRSIEIMPLKNLTSFSWIESKKYKMKKSFLMIGLLAVLAGCGGNQTQNNTQNNSDSGIVSADSILLVSCILDEAFDGQWFYPMFSDSIDLEGIKEIHLIPSYNVGDDSSTAVPYMIGIAQIDYVFYQTEFESFSGKVSVYYDGFKKIPVTQYALVNGQPDGELNVFDPQGKKIISRIYEARCLQRSDY
jgi:hypothetical protein